MIDAKSCGNECILCIIDFPAWILCKCLRKSMGSKLVGNTWGLDRGRVTGPAKSLASHSAHCDKGQVRKNEAISRFVALGHGGPNAFIPTKAPPENYCVFQYFDCEFRVDILLSFNEQIHIIPSLHKAENGYLYNSSKSNQL
jgi:hypothetical protein